MLLVACPIKEKREAVKDLVGAKVKIYSQTAWLLRLSY